MTEEPIVETTPPGWTTDDAGCPKICEDKEVTKAGVEVIGVEMIGGGDGDSKLTGELGGELVGLVQLESSHPIPSATKSEPLPLPDAEPDELFWRCLFASC